MYPSISLNSHNQVFLCYQTLTQRKLKFLCGKKNDHSVTLSSRMAITNHTHAGEYLCACLTSEGDIFVVYKVPVGLTVRFNSGTMPITEQPTLRPANSGTTTNDFSEIALSSVQRPNGTDPPTEDTGEDHSNL